MQIILALVVGAAIGTGFHFLLADRYTRGLLVAPIIGAVAAGLAWLILTWSGVGTDSVWLWLSMLVAPIVVTYPAVLFLAKSRVAHDERERERLRIS
jgi:uncharacterized membrane protein YeaQ/YmgE (transglycosylase-associated protein family)